ncbi:MAG: DEAD/DEAH box helicase, partial [Alistipes sp.]|nr:DEAD/DEAH box helicase [Alistipes sp.]
MTFQELKLSAPLLRAVEEKGYTTPTPIQARAIPPALAGRDLLGCAQTGTGKTAAFTLPILQLLDDAPRTKGRRPIRALVLTPTRELAIQIDECCRDYACHTSLRHAVIFGGVNQRPQVDALQRGVDILIATPGRLLDLIGQGYISLDDVRHFVLDEADRMLDMGFIHDIRRILPLLPERKQTLFFSATMPDSIASLAASLLHDPAEVTVTPPASVVETIGQQVGFVAKPEKSKRLVALLSDSEAEAVLVFSRTKHGADRIARILNKAGIAASAIHGDKSQGAREKAMKGFKAGTCRVLVATDIAARGIDISELPLVINYDLPEVPETYVHRIGRTGRAGCEGRAYSFCAEEEIPLLRDIEKTIGRRIPVDEAAEQPEWAPAAAPEIPQERKSPTKKQAPKPAAAPRTGRPAARQQPAEAPQTPKS